MIISLMTLLLLAAPLEASHATKDPSPRNQTNHFNQSLALAGGEGFSKATVKGSVSSANRIFQVLNLLADALPDGKDKSKQSNNIRLVKEFLENYLRDSGFNTAHDDNTPITWQPEKWTTITSSMNTTLTGLCAQVITMINNETDGHKLKKAFSATRRKNVALIRKNILPAMDTLLKELKRPKNLSDYVPLADSFVDYTKKTFSMLEIDFPEARELRRTQSAPAILAPHHPPARPDKPLPPVRENLRRTHSAPSVLNSDGHSGQSQKPLPSVPHPVPHKTLPALPSEGAHQKPKVPQRPTPPLPLKRPALHHAPITAP